jgi:hypothetical protein
MSRKSIHSNDVGAFAQIYKKMNKKDQDKEIDALSDQVLAFLLATDYTSIDILYDGHHILTFEFKPDLKHMENVNKEKLI